MQWWVLLNLIFITNLFSFFSNDKFITGTSSSSHSYYSKINVREKFELGSLFDRSVNYSWVKRDGSGCGLACKSLRIPRCKFILSSESIYASI